MAVVEKVKQYDELRIGLFSGIVASGGATVGWLLWLSLQAFARDWKILLAPLLGLLIGHASDWLEHYYKVSRYEAEHGIWHADGHEPTKEAQAADAAKKTHNLRIWTLALTFLALACEHIVGHLVQEFMLPFLASIATLFPVGAIFGIAFFKEEKKEGIFDLLGFGAFAGALAASAAALVQYVIYGSVAVGALCGWWILVGLGFSICSPNKAQLTPGKAVGALAVVMGLILICSIPKIYDFLEKIPGPPGVPAKAIGFAVDGALSSPDLPAKYWSEAELRAAAAEAKVTDHDEESKWGKALAKMIGYDPSSSGGSADEPRDALSFTPESLADKIQKDSMALSRYNFDKLNSSAIYQKNSETRHETLGKELTKGFSSGLVRSLIVLFLFALGLGFAPKVEGWLRPLDYPSSRTFKHDKTLLYSMLGVILLAALLIRISPHI